MKTKQMPGIYGGTVEYYDFGKAEPPYPRSDYIVDIRWDKRRYHLAEGDMWPITWGADDNLYGAAGDNRHSPMNFWRFVGDPVGKSPANSSVSGGLDVLTHGMTIVADVVDNLPVDPNVFATDPRVAQRWGLKPASLLDVEGMLYFAVEAQNYGTDPPFMRQTNIHAWIVTSCDYGKTWNRFATDKYFFTGRLASPHFIQHGRGYEDAPDGYVYAYFTGVGEDGKSYWENGDRMLLGRVPKQAILDRSAWTFFAGEQDGEAQWEADDDKAVPVFRYDKMCSENHACYNKAIGRYLLCNYAFTDEDGCPRPNHQGVWPESADISQVTMYEAPNPWGPWKLFYRCDDFGAYGEYQPTFTPKWMYEDGRVMFLVSSGSWDDYNFTIQKCAIRLAGDKDFPACTRFFR